jgi:site-specific recombinase XerD
VSSLPALSTTGALTTERHVEANPAAVYLATLRPTGRYTMLRTLDRLAGMMAQTTWDAFPWASLRYAHVQALRSKLAEQYKANTVNLALCAVRRVAEEAWKLGQMPAEDFQKIKSVDSVTGSTLPAGRAIGSGELGAMLRACAQDHTPAGIRDSAIIAMGYAGGLRRAELAGLQLADVLEDDGDTITMRVKGKRNKERLVYLDNGAASTLRDWLALRGTEPGPLFWSGRKGGHVNPGQGMTPQAVRDIIAKRADAAGVENVTPHDLRRSFVSDLLDAGVDIKTVADMAGHASVTTTARYDRRPEARKKRAAKSLHVPYLRHTLAN